MNLLAHSDRRRGSILFVTFIVTIAVVMILASATSTAVQSGKTASYRLARTQALALAEGVTEVAQSRMLNQVANFRSMELSGTVTLDGMDYTYTAVQVEAPFSQTDSDGVSNSRQHYMISATVPNDDAFATVERVVNLTMTPLFQFMIFNRGDLEILPGPPMNLGGRVHANGDIYLGAGSSLTVDTEYLRTAGKVYRKRKNDNSATGGTVNIKVKGNPSFVNLDPGMDSTYSDWTTHATDTWKGTVQDSSHGVTEVAAPAIQSIKAFNADGSKGYYHSNAGLVIVDQQAYDSQGRTLLLPPGTITEKTMYDARERRMIRVTEVDMALLNASGDFPPNGLIYSYQTDAGPNQPNGTRLTNGAELNAPLMVVSEGPVYVHGDFNTVNKKGAAVMADAVNLLSNAWDDSKMPGRLPAASATQYNLAFVTGNVPTPDGGGNYSGGFENLPRFHENWTGKRATIRGSFVNNYESEISQGLWKYGRDVYTAPIRDWQYDLDLTQPGGLPPFTPNAVYFDRIYWDDKIPLPFGLAAVE